MPPTAHAPTPDVHAPLVAQVLDAAQYCCPAGHEGRQRPETHVKAPLQAVPQLPQLLLSAPRLTSHPFVDTRSQSAYPLLHAYPHTPPAQVPAALVGDAHAADVYPSPSASQVRAVEPSAQSVVPGVHTHGRQLSSRQVCRAAQAVEVYPRPSPLHVRRVVPLAQSLVPGVHVHAMQTPVRHVSRAPHEVVVNPRPSALQVVRVDPSRQFDAPGVQIRTTHALPEQVSVERQSVVV